jgi:hypothetical protein
VKIDHGSKTLARLVGAILLSGSMGQAAIVDNFEGGGPAAVGTQLLDGPAPAIMTTGGSNGNFLRLLAGVGNQNNHYTYDLVDTGAFDTIHAMFDFRITPGLRGLADGFHFLLIPTSTYGSTGDGPNVLAKNRMCPAHLASPLTSIPESTTCPSIGTMRSISSTASPCSAESATARMEFSTGRRSMCQRVGNGSNVSVTVIGDSLGAATPTYKAFEVAIGQFAAV